MTTSKQTLIHYQINWKPSGFQPGTKRGLTAGIGDQLRAKVLLRDHPDPRRLDLRASMRDPFERLWVRDFYLNTAFKVIVLLDLSASMGYRGTVNRMHVAAGISQQLAISAYRSSDAFGLYAANEKPIKNATLPPRVNKSAWLWVHQHLAKLKPSGKSVAGLLNLVPTLPQRRSLIFVVSDFRWPAGQYRQLLKSLNHHDVIPMVLQDPAETTALPKRGIASVQDMETGQTQFIWMRPSLKAKLMKQQQSQWDELSEISHRYGVQPFAVNGAFNPAKLNQYFMARHG